MYRDQLVIAQDKENRVFFAYGPLINPTIFPKEGVFAIFGLNLSPPKIHLSNFQQVCPYGGIIQPVFHSANDVISQIFVF